MQKKILFIGAGFLQSFVIKRAKELGYYVLAVDGNRNAEGFKFADKYEVIDIVDKTACFAFAKKNNIDGVLTVATDYGVLTAAYITEQLKLSGINYCVAQLIKNKYLVRKRLYDNCVDDTQQVFEVDENTDFIDLAKRLSFPIVVKPCDGSGSRGISKVDNAGCLKSACIKAINYSLIKKAEIETFIYGQEYGCESLVTNDGQIYVFPVMKKMMTEHPYYAELGHAIPSGLTIEIEKKIKNCVEKAICALRIDSGAVNMDLIVTDKGDVHIIDVGARMGGNMIGPCLVPYGSGIDYVDNLIKNAVNDPLEFKEKEHSAVATRLIALKSGTINRLPDFQALEKKYNVEIYHHLKLGQKVNEYHTNLDGCGYIVAQSDSVEKAQINAADALNEIEEIVFEDER